MHRTEADGFVEVGGKRQYINQVLPGVPGTILDAEDRNAVQEEISTVIEEAGLTLRATASADKAAGYTQLDTAIGVKITAAITGIYNRGHWVNVEPPGGLMPGFDAVTVEGLPETGATPKEFAVTDINLFRRQLAGNDVLTSVPVVVPRPSTEIFGSITVRPQTADSAVLLLPWSFFGVSAAVGMQINKGVSVYTAYLAATPEQRPVTVTSNETGIYISLDGVDFPFNPSAGTGLDATIYFNIQAIKNLL